jgi:hypothetical protein
VVFSALFPDALEKVDKVLAPATTLALSAMMTFQTLVLAH